MLSTSLDDILGPHSKISVLRVLFKQDDISGREVARRAELSPRAASQALTWLVRAGIVRRKPVGATHLFSINRRSHLASSALENLFAEEKQLPGTIGQGIMEAIGRYKCVSLAIFGSFARGESAMGSDLDVLVLLKDSQRVPKVKALLAERAEKFQDSFGLRFAPYVIGAAEFADRFKKNDKLMKAMVREARVIAGKPLSEVLVDESEEKKH